MKRTRKIITALGLLAAASLASNADAANILLVTDSSPVPAPGAGITDLLTGDGHTVTAFDSGTYGWNLVSNNGVDFANSFDAIVVTRSVNYGGIRAHGATWNALTAPKVNVHMFLVGGPFSASSWDWTDGAGTTGGNPDGTALVVGDASDPIFNGVALTAGDTLTPDLYSATSAYWDTNGNDLIPGITVLASNPSDSDQIAIAHAAAGALAPGGAEQYFFASSNGENDNNVWSAEGEKVFLNAVNTLVPEPSSLALLGLGGLLVARRRRG